MKEFLFLNKYGSIIRKDSNVVSITFDNDNKIDIERVETTIPMKLTEQMKSENKFDTNYINRWGYQSFGMDFVIIDNSYSAEDVKFWESDYNKFVSITDYNAKSHIRDSLLIDIWESIFWPGAYNTSHRSLRDVAGDCLIRYVEHGSEPYTIELVTKDYCITFTGAWKKGNYQKYIMLTLLTLYECEDVYNKVKNEWWPDTDDVVSVIKVKM